MTEDSDEIRSCSFRKKRKNSASVQFDSLSMGPDSAELASKLNELGVLYYVQGNHRLLLVHYY